MSNFLDDNLNQSVFFDINYLEVLGSNTFEYCLYHLLENDEIVSDFYARYKNKNVGRKAYPPALLLRVIFYAYYRGHTSSRVIERLCKTDLKFIALAAGRQPHFTTIANFVSSNCEAMSRLFHKVLLICDQSGLIGKEHFAIDGCKLPTNASKQWSGTHKELRKKSDKLKEAAQKIIDKHLSNDSDKRGGNNIAADQQQTIDTLMKNAKKIDDFLSTNEPRMGQGRRKQEVQSNITDNQSAKMTTSKGTIQGMACVTAADEKHQVIVHAQAFGMGQEQATLKPMVEGIKKNFGDGIFKPSLVLTADTGFSSEATMQYLFDEKINAVVPDNQFRKRNPVFSDSDFYKKHKELRKKTRKDKAKTNMAMHSSEFKVSFSSNTCICPAGKELKFLGDDYEGVKGFYTRFRGELEDCRNCSMQSKCMRNPVKEKGRQVSFLNDGQEKITCLDLMKQKIDSPEGRRMYSRRMWTIEPVFGNITSNKGLNRIGLRGEAKATAQWLMYCMVHNIEKLWKNSEVESWA
ncbi:Transposase, IS4 family [Oleispira antarctica RB-8]|uniref:Transposase, IS4 family n=1 Tax=Oleispira antarctica RB-8 TaxID=698738 RepID=R4YPZ7_OLEAN|nr:Transposase, IS4 family [Oleispira antarctica RB-8]